MAFAGHAGTIHRPGRGLLLDTAVVICAPVGREGRCAYRPLWRWAGELAGQGLQVLRYDHLGEGDSVDVDPAADQWQAWLRGLGQATAFCRERTGARRLVVVGLRAGATLAAAADAGADELVLIAPFETGAAWLNELRLAARVKGGAIHSDGAVEVDGLHLSSATVTSLEALRLPALDGVGRALVAGSKSARFGQAAERAPFPGLNKLFKDAHVNEFPQGPLDRIAGWILQGAAQASRPPPPLAAAALTADDWTETTVAFGPGLRGVVCLPRLGPPRQGVIFGNTGGDPRAGIGSFGARACRALASSGVAALRIDFAGVGESEAETGWRSHVYETSRLGDFKDAAAVLRAHGVEEVTLAGVCTGGYHAVHAVLAGAGFDKAVAFNAWLVWRSGDRLESTEHRAALRPEDMPLIAQGGASLRARFMRMTAGMQQALRLSWKAMRPDASAVGVRRAVAEASRRGVQIRLVFGRGDVSTRGLHADFHRRGRWLTRRPGLSVSLIRGLDHALFSRESQAAACAELFEFLGVAGKARPSAEPLDLPDLEPAARAPGGGMSAGLPALTAPLR